MWMLFDVHYIMCTSALIFLVLQAVWWLALPAVYWLFSVQHFEYGKDTILVIWMWSLIVKNENLMRVVFCNQIVNFCELNVTLFKFPVSLLHLLTVVSLHCYRWFHHSLLAWLILMHFYVFFTVCFPDYMFLMKYLMVLCHFGIHWLTKTTFGVAMSAHW